MATTTTVPLQPIHVPLRRKLALGFRWIINPVSVAGTAAGFELIFSTAQQRIFAEFERFQQHSEGHQMLIERPDLLASLSDFDALARMPENSFGRGYLALMQRNGVSEPQGLSALADVEALGAKLGWPEDVVWFVSRLSNTHDLWHVLAGYDTSMTGECAVDIFTYGQQPLPALKPLMWVIKAIRPSIGWRRWWRYLEVARVRGEQAAPLTMVWYEKLLPQPLNEVREQLNIADPALAHPEGVLSENPYIRSRFSRTISRLFRKSDERAIAKVAAKLKTGAREI